MTTPQVDTKDPFEFKVEFLRETSVWRVTYPDDTTSAHSTPLSLARAIGVYVSQHRRDA